MWLLLERLSESCTRFLWTSHYVPLPCAGFALCHFAVINHCHEYTYVLSLVSSPSRSLNLEALLETPDAIIKEVTILTTTDSVCPPRFL